jgi:hypothetical protein
MTAVVAWWAVGLVLVVVLGRLLVDPIQWAGEPLARRHQARLRAEALLLAWLSPSQRTQYRAWGWFEVTTTAGREAGQSRLAGAAGSSTATVPSVSSRTVASRCVRCRVSPRTSGVVPCRDQARPSRRAGPRAAGPRPALDPGVRPGRRTLWVPDIRSPHATCAYSWISPPSRSRRTTLPAGATTAGSPGPSGGSCPKARCGRCTL